MILSNNAVISVPGRIITIIIIILIDYFYYFILPNNAVIILNSIFNQWEQLICMGKI